jgi:hypothetical protein
MATKKTKKATFKPGDKVILKANKKEGWKREEGEVIGEYDNGVHMVRLLAKYRSGKSDDLLREVPVESLVLKPAKKGKV